MTTQTAPARSRTAADREARLLALAAELRTRHTPDEVATYLGVHRSLSQLTGGDLVTMADVRDLLG